MSSQSWDGGDSSVASVGQGWKVTQSRGSVGNGSLGSQVLGPGSLHSRLVHRDHGSVGVAHQPVERGRGDGRETTNNNQELHVCDA